MVSRAHVFFTATIIVLVCLAGAGQVDADDPVKLKPPPWHLVDLWWDAGKDRQFESFALDVTIEGTIPAETRLYVAPIGLAHLGKTQFYGGIQTQSDGYTKQDRRLRGIGPGLLMSMWGQRSEDAVRPADGGFFQSSGHEGDFVSVRRPYVWTPGAYTWRVTRMDKENIGGKPHTWVGAFLYCHAKDENIFVGATRFPGENLVIGRNTASFVEIYGPLIPVDKIPQATVTFGNLRVNGEAIAGVRVSAHYTADVPARANATAKDGQVVIQVGQPAPPDRPVSVQLLPK